MTIRTRRTSTGNGTRTAAVTTKASSTPNALPMSVEMTLATKPFPKIPRLIPGRTTTGKSRGRM